MFDCDERWSAHEADCVRNFQHRMQHMTHFSARLDILTLNSSCPMQQNFGCRRLEISTFCKMAQSEALEKKQPKSFEALTPELSTWILDYASSMGFVRTTPVQAMAIPLLMGNKDLVVEVGLTFSTSNRAHFSLMFFEGSHRKRQDIELLDSVGRETAQS
jgi:hypothetical protein